MQKETWRQSWLKSINELTSLDLQINSWLDKKQSNPHWSFIEFMCIYFDDLLSDNDYEYFINTGWVTKQEYETIKDWHLALMRYKATKENDYDHEAILNDINWTEIVMLGEKSKIKLITILSKSESQILNEEINYLNYI